MTDIQRILGELQAALDIRVVTGQITLNLHENELQNWEIKTRGVVDRRNPLTTTTAGPKIRLTR